MFALQVDDAAEPRPAMAVLNGTGKAVGAVWACDAVAASASVRVARADEKRVAMRTILQKAPLREELVMLST